jgi:hypothetical protein
MDDLVLLHRGIARPISIKPAAWNHMMPTTRLPISALVLFSLAGPAAAQADLTGTGGGPLSTQTAPNTTAVGVTKPPSRDASPTWRDNPDRRTREELENERIESSICIGCGPK